MSQFSEATKEFRTSTQARLDSNQSPLLLGACCGSGKPLSRFRVSAWCQGENFEWLRAPSPRGAIFGEILGVETQMGFFTLKRLHDLNLFLSSRE